MGIASYDYRVYYRYDENGSPIGFDLIKDGTTSTYTYEKNIQGDIVGIISDSTRRRVVTYVYDAWGNLTDMYGSAANTVGKYNSLRYRGYYYDSETGYYYLQSRYYDPSYKRFINADDPELISSLTKESVLGGNLFAYCKNNAVNNSDPTGKWLCFTGLYGKPLLYIKAEFTLAIANYYYNKRRYITNSYIYNQHIGPVSKLRFGLFKMSYNGCEIISVYNALKLKGKSASIADIAFEFEINGSSLLFGLFGSNPHLIGNYLRFHGIKYEKSTNESKSLKKLVGYGRVLILSFWTKKDKNNVRQIHTVAVKCGKDGKYYVYNRYKNSKGVNKFNRFKQIYEGGIFIVCYYLK